MKNFGNALGLGFLALCSLTANSAGTRYTCGPVEEMADKVVIVVDDANQFARVQFLDADNPLSESDRTFHKGARNKVSGPDAHNTKAKTLITDKKITISNKPWWRPKRAGRVNDFISTELGKDSFTTLELDRVTNQFVWSVDGYKRAPASCISERLTSSEPRRPAEGENDSSPQPSAHSE